jgi:hypothetical protein
MRPNQNAAALAGANTASQVTGNLIGNRFQPADDLTCQTLAALLWDAGRARFRALGLGPEVFDDGDAAMIAGVLLAERAFTQAECRVLWHDDGRLLPWYVAVDDCWSLSPALAVRTVERFAAARARWWFATWLGWIIDGLRHGQPLAWAIRELDELLGGVRDEGRAAA